MKLFKHVEPVLMLAFFLLCALGALQIGAPRQKVTASNIVDSTDARPLGARSGQHAAMALPMQARIPLPMQAQTPLPMHAQIPLPMQTPMQMQTQRPKQMPVLTPMPTPMPVVHIIGRRMTDAEKSGAAASAG